MTGKERVFSELARLNAMVCPVCGEALERSGDSLVCGKGHTLNVNRKGYLNLLSRKMDSFYDETLFEARERVYMSGLYRPVLETIMRDIPQGARRILDCGCGEGWYLTELLGSRPELMGAGVDLSVPAITRAAHRGRGVFMVCDIKHLPFGSAVFDVVLDILTPADYAAFARVLKPDGVLVKVYPGREYLREIREKRGMPLYEEGSVEAWLQEHTRQCRVERVTCRQRLDAAVWKDLVYMTPLNQDLSDQDKERLAQDASPEVTLDLNVAVCRFS